MKAVVNLAGRKKQIIKTKTIVLRAFWIFFGLVSFGFLIYFGYPLWKTYRYKRTLEDINSEAIVLSNQIRANNETVNQFVLSKSILDQIEIINSSKFAYKRYLDEIVAMLPLSSILRNVDFQTKGWVVVSVFLPDVASLSEMETRLTDKTIVDQTVFSSVFSEDIVSDKSGGFIIKMHFELRKNG